MRRKKKKLKLKLSLMSGMISTIDHHEVLVLDRENRCAILCFNEALSALDLYKIYRATAVRESRWPFFKRINDRISTLSTLLNAFFITVSIGLLGAFGNAFFEILTKLVTKGQAAIYLDTSTIFYAVFLLFFLILAISPRILNDNFTSVIDWINKRLSKEQRLHRKAARGIIKLARKNSGVSTIRLVNLGNYTHHHDFLFKHLLPLALGKQIQFELYIKKDEADDLLRECDKKDYIVSSLNHKDATGAVHVNMLQDDEILMLQLLISFSTYNANDADTTCFDVSLELALLYMDKYRYRLAGYDHINKLLLERMVYRCIRDYGLIQEITIGDQKRHKLTTPIEFRLNKSEYFTVVKTLTSDYASFKDELKEPLSHLIVLAYLKNSSFINSNKADALSGFIKSVDESEDYSLLIDYEDLIYSDTKGEDGVDVLKVINSSHLLRLGNINFMAGSYLRALDAFSTASLMYPLKAKIGKAKTFERKGDFNAAINEILEVEELIKQRSFTYYEDKLYLLEFYLEKAWIIVSSRIDTYYNQGKEAIEKANHLFTELDNMEYDVRYLFIYYNSIANYHEWDRSYESAIKAYKTILELPGCKMRSRSSALVNIGITYRLRAKSSASFVDNMHLSIHHLRMGVEMKYKLAEMAQYPVAAHNLAESCILLAIETKEKEQADALLNEAYQIAQKGLDIQREANATKKRGQLLVEALIARVLLGDTTEELKSLIVELSTWLLNNKEGYDVEVVNEMLDHAKKRKNIDIKSHMLLQSVN